MVKRRRPVTDSRAAVAYVRVSTDEQHLGPEVQKAAIARWATGAGVRVVAWHEDRGVSGGADLDACHGLTAALESVRTTGAGVLVVAKRDRLARDVVKAAMVERLAERDGAKVVSAAGEGNGSDPMAEVMRGIVDLFAQYERRIISARTTAALAVKRERGERISRHLPYGYELAADGKTLAPNAAEQETLKVAAEMRRGGLTYEETARALAEAGRLSRAGTPFTTQTVWKMLNG